MAVVLFTVRATIAPDREEAYNHWYHTEHIPQLLRYNGAVGARRYRKIDGDEQYQYVTQYEFANEEIYRRFVESDHLKEMIAEYDANFGDASDRTRDAWVQVWP